MATTTVKVISLAQYKEAKSIARLDVFTSKKGNKYATLPNGDFAGMLAEDIDLTKPIVVFTMRDEDTAEVWDFIANGTPREPDASI